MVVVGAVQPVATTGGTGATGGTLNVVGGGTTVVPSTQVFTPPQEIVLRSATPTQVFTPSTPKTVVVRSSTPAPSVFTPPRAAAVTSGAGNLPFTGSNVAFGLIAGVALLCAGGLILLRRREGELAWALDHQASALDRLTRP